ncbi:head-tail connector protein [Rummeliibacillus stabekisii]|uniref:head-tail connector protein n=1 Tax=Rummeliibacillus stabekisii TaxID=241244 RepID=UPI003720BC3C
MKINDEAFNLNLVKRYLRIDGTYDDELIQLMIDGAKEYIQTYLNKKFVVFEDIPAEFTLAALNLLAEWYEHRTIGSEKAAHEYLYNFTALLDTHRTWAL